ncbi:MAG: hypothetical protein BGO99_12250 [Nitrosospira sp. 56-18]|jgi:hypothetical protein|nr:MAG: hypothetical protein BGO99_12250 [Nitrosospira sp. 56-18]
MNWITDGWGVAVSIKPHMAHQYMLCFISHSVPESSAEFMHQRGRGRMADCALIKRLVLGPAASVIFINVACCEHFKHLIEEDEHYG